MKIYHITHTYYPNIGGLENVINKLSKAQTKLGHEVYIVAPKIGNNAYFDDENVLRIKYFKLGYNDLSFPLEDTLNKIKDADIIHAHSHSSYFNISIIKKAKKKGLKTALYYMAVDSLRDHPNPIIRNVGFLYARYLTKTSFNYTDLKLSRSKRDIEILKKNYGINDVHYLPDAIDEKIMTMPSHEEEFRKKFNIYNENIFVYVGRMHYLKGIEILLKAIPHVINEVKDLKILLIGPGDNRRFVKLAKKLNIQNYVEFLGFLDEELKYGAIDSSIALVLPSLSDHVEVYSVVVSESWARKKAVITTNVGELSYRIKNMENGILVKPYDPIDIANAMLLLIQDSNLRKKLGENGHKEIKTWDKIAQESIRLYKTI
ncbi:glycosyltransferase family 4 protein [Caldisphaera lagunensis]|uniref:glycosyltransferase family 4 protein n=1 Tax=Caldisphaera lagunensis TaxID=200415 RepID=UPI0006621D16|nr:glycosyltransferase family 4 protein [Caldisphaera lagunensis]